MGPQGGQDIHIRVAAWSHTLDSDNEVRWPLSDLQGNEQRDSAYNELDHEMNVLCKLSRTRKMSALLNFLPPRIVYRLSEMVCP